MGKAQVDLVHSQAFSVDLSTVGAPVTVRADGDEIVVFVRLALRPRDDVVNIDFDVTTSRNGASVASLDQYSPPDFCGNSWPILRI